MQPTISSIALLAIVFSSSVSADTPIHQTREVAADAKIVIHNVKGEVKVNGWDQNRVQIDGTLGTGAKPLQVSGDAHLLDIRVESAGPRGWFGGDNGMSPSVLDIHVPRGASLGVHVVSAPVSVENVDGATVEVNTVSGRVHLATHANAVNVDSVSADVDLAGQVRKLDVQTVSGDVQAATVSDNASAQTVSGRIQISGGPLSRASLGTVSGNVQLDAAVAPAGTWRIETMSGDVRLGLPADASAQIKADTFSGDLRSDVGQASGDNGPGKHLGARLGGGNGTISIDTFSGDVRIEHGAH